MAIIDYKQYDYDARYAGGSFAGNACGPTSCAILLGISPLTTAQWLTNNGFATNGNGTVWDGIQSCLSAFGGGGKRLYGGLLDGVHSSQYFTQFQQWIQSGKTGIILFHAVESTYWTTGGHYVAITGYKDGLYKVSDPASVTRSGWHKWDDFIGNISILYTSTIMWSGSPAPATSYTVTFHQLQNGSKGAEVLLLQKTLYAHGFYKKSYGFDGIYGPKTEDGVKGFQALANEEAGKSVLVQDGIFGPNTRAYLYGFKGDTHTFEQLQRGDHGIDVLALQRILSADGYYAGAIDRSFGWSTWASLGYAQKDLGIAVDRICGPTSWKKLLKF